VCLNLCMDRRGIHGLLITHHPRAGTSMCLCSASSVRLPVGLEACSSPLHVGGTASTSATLPLDMCQYFKQVGSRVLNSDLFNAITHLPLCVCLSLRDCQPLDEIGDTKDRQLYTQQCAQTNR
jgi:hypothetical protein